MISYLFLLFLIINYKNSLAQSILSKSRIYPTIFCYLLFLKINALKDSCNNKAFYTMDLSVENQRQAEQTKISNRSSALTQTTNSILNTSSSLHLKPNIQNIPEPNLNAPQKLSVHSAWAWFRVWTIQKTKKYTITVILLPNILQSLVKSATERYYEHQVQFILVGIFVSLLNFMLASYFLYKWFVTGQGEVKAITKQKLAQIQKIKEQVQSYFTPGNQGNLLKLYCLIAFVGLLSYILPNAVFKGGIGLLSDLYKEIRNYLMDKYRSKIQKLQQFFYQKLLEIQASLPKYSDYVQNRRIQS